ncbi:MAG: XylR family transcriptional regulator [Tepidisphaeraceae bacterium]
MADFDLHPERANSAVSAPRRRHAPRKQQPRIALFLRESKKSILLGIAKYVREFGPWRLFLQPTEHDVSMPQWLARWEGDGIIGRITDPAAAKLVKSTGLPLVDVLGVVRRPDIPLVHSDDAAVGRMAAEHLLERGFRHFGCYGPPDAIWMQQRRAAFEQTVAQAGGDCLHYEKHWIVAGPTGWDSAEEQLASWLSALPKPAGVMTANDQLGQRLLSAARRAGIHVPEELAVVGVDDDRATCEVCDPPLSSIQVDSEQQGYKAAELLDALMNGEPPPPEPVLVQPTGVHIRQSSNILAIDDPYIADAVRFIREYACEGIGVEDVLREVPLSRSVLQRRFRRLFAQTANSMIVEMRLRRAQQLLIETDFSIGRIAEMAGFRYQRYLGAIFRKKLGVTPLHFRKQAGPGRHLER